MHSEQIETVIVGAGQAGLSTGYWLQQKGRPFVILDGNARVGDNWRHQWDSLRLYTPVKYDGLPGMPFPGRKWSYPGKDDVADFLEAYADRHELPVRTGTRVRRLERRGEGFTVVTDDRQIEARNVVIATGTFGRTPHVPDFADELDSTIVQLHSSEYRRPAQLQPGPVLVVGASHSGADIAYEVAASHPTILCGRDCGQIPIRLESPGARLVLPVMVFLARHVITRRTPIGRRAMDHIRFHGGPHLRVKRADLAARGVERVTSRVEGASNGLPRLDDGRVTDVANVIWCTGFRQVFDWIDAPICDETGWPRELRGVVDEVPGLFFCGLSFQYTFSSMVFPGVGRDAAFIAAKVAARTADRAGRGAVAPAVV